uniref:CCHC-type domain-containing protein n=1 Tax=Globodera rostochiensis TaxID=31243 RepID=A0A914GUX4_GLORO
MSIRIRMVLGPQTAKLRERVLRARELLNREEGEDNAAIMEARALLSRVTLRVEAELQIWEEIINGLQGAERVAEQDRFTAFLEDVRQIPQLLVDAHAVMDEMEVEIAGEIEEGNSQVGNNPEPQEANRQQAMQQEVRETAAHPRIRLPELRMPTFAGEPLEWPAFWQTFESAVHNQGHLTAIDKMNYLIGCLKGKAARAVMGYRGGENYTNMVTTLQRLYGNQQVIAEALQAELFNLPNVEDSAESLQPFTENLERICLQLNALGHPENSLMCMAVKAKLPRQVLTELVRMEREEGLRWQMSDVRRGLAEIVSVREEVQRCSRSLRKEVNRTSNSYRQPVQRDQRRQSAERARAFVAVQERRGRESAPPGKPKIQCLFCGGSHWADECRKVASVQQRTKLLSEQERCFMCLRRGHRAPECRSRRSCAKCNGPHNRVICPRSSKPAKSWNTAPRGFPPKRNQAEVNMATAESVESGVVATAVSDPKRVLLMARRINVFSEKNPAKKMRILAFFDPGSQVTMVKSSVVQALSPQKIKEGLLEVSGFHSEIPVKLDAPQYKLQVALEDGHSENLVAYRADWIVKSIRRAEWSTGKVEAVDDEPDLLIGMPEFWKFFKRREQISASLFRIHTSVGPIVCGRDIPLEIGEQRQICAVMSAKADCEIAEVGIDMAKNFWDLQLIGIKDDPKENDDDTAMQIFEKKAKRLPDGRYCAGWPWKEYPPELPSNYNMAYRRLGGLLEKLRKTPELLRKYDESIRREHELGFFEKGERKEGYPEHFLPHHGVVTHKLRIVFDASAHPRGEKSLNECMFRGPLMIPDLVGILMRFRLPPIALWADLEKAFNAISMDEEDREFVKFLWVKDPEKKPTADNLQVFRCGPKAFGREWLSSGNRVGRECIRR